MLQLPKGKIRIILITILILVGFTEVFFVYTITKNLRAKPAAQQQPIELRKRGASTTPTITATPIGDTGIYAINGSVVGIRGQIVQVKSINQAITSPSQVTKKSPAIVTYNVTVTPKTEIIRHTSSSFRNVSSDSMVTPTQTSLSDLRKSNRVTVATETPILPTTTDVTASKIEAY